MVSIDDDDDAMQRVLEFPRLSELEDNIECEPGAATTAVPTDKPIDVRNAIGRPSLFPPWRAERLGLV